MVAASRVLPWKRHDRQVVAGDDLTTILAIHARYHDKSNQSIIHKAYRQASIAHRDQVRSSGEAYINHPLAVARIVADLKQDADSIAAALLHDAVEDTEITLELVTEEFGETVAMLVDGVTKLERLQFDSKEAQQAATMRKMLVAMTRDIRVLVIKLADRLHNMRTIAGTTTEKQRRIAQETLDIYAPLSYRLGLQEVRHQLEELSFAVLSPKRYAELDTLVAGRAPEMDAYIGIAVAEIHNRLHDAGIRAEVVGRGKTLWSIYDKMVQKGRDFDEIFDLVAVRIIVESNKDCYAALGSIHARWKPLPGRFKDYIAIPKFNFYRSLHTTVMGPNGKQIEVQIRTREMHDVAEFGVAAHWAYKDRDEAPTIEWLRRLLDVQPDEDDPAMFLDVLKTDLEKGEIYVFTPKGKVIALPVGACVVDFAYAVHTEIGHGCVGGKVNGRLVPIDHRLTSGDNCEVVISQLDAGPSVEWLTFVVSARARSSDSPAVRA